MKFRVVVKNESGVEEKKVIEAPTRFGVYSEVEKENGKVVSIEEGSGFTLPKWLDISFGTGVKQAQLIVLTKNLSAMLSAGLSLSRALSVVERQARNKRLKVIIADIEEQVQKGSSFHDALATHKNLFSTLFIAMVRAGEESGALAGSLTIVGTQMERADALVRKVKGAMIYPGIILSAVVVIAILMMIYVVPTLTATFVSLKVKVPLATQIITNVSNFMAANAILVFIALGIVVFGGYLFIRSKPGKRTILFIGLHMPVIGELVRETYAARTARTISSLLASGVPVLDALSITKEVVGDSVFAKVIGEAEERVRKGEAMSAAFAAHGKLYPLLMSDMAAVGEETGKSADMLKQVAEFYEEDVEQKTKDLSTIIEPMLMLVIGTAVGIFAVAMIAPIYSLSSAF